MGFLLRKPCIHHETKEDHRLFRYRSETSKIGAHPGPPPALQRAPKAPHSSHIQITSPFATENMIQLLPLCLSFVRFRNERQIRVEIRSATSAKYSQIQVDLIFEAMSAELTSFGLTSRTQSGSAKVFAR